MEDALGLICCSLPSFLPRYYTIVPPVPVIGSSVFRLPMPYNVELDNQTIPLSVSQLPYPAVKLVITRA